MKVRIYKCIYAYANCFTFLRWGVRRASVSCCDVYSCVVFYGGHRERALQHHMVFIWTTPRRGGLRFGMARLILAEQAVPRGRSLRFLGVKGGRGARIDTLTCWRPRRGKKMKPIKSDSLQVQVKPVVSIP